MQGQLCLRSPRDKQGSAPAPDRVLSPRALEAPEQDPRLERKRDVGGKR